jgi:hypothetical protein
MNKEARDHTTKGKPYEKALSFGEKIGIRKPVRVVIRIQHGNLL